MTPPLIPLEMGISLLRPGSSQFLAQASTETTTTTNTNTLGALWSDFIGFLPTLVGALVVLLGGLVIAWIVSWIVKSILQKTSIDDKIASAVTGRPASDMPVAKWVSTAVFWVIAIIALAAFLDALELRSVSGPINDAISTVLTYIPLLFSAGLLLAVAWAVATLVKTVVNKALAQFNLDDRLAENTGVDPRENSVRIHETVGNVAYWFVFLLFLPLILNTLQLSDGLLEPVNGLINQFLTAIPKIIKALLIFGIGWLVAKIVRGIVTNLLSATGIDGVGQRVGLSRSSVGTGLSLSGLLGTLAYPTILLVAGISALEALDISAISGPAVLMLQQILEFIPKLLSAAAVLALFYFIGKFVKDLVTDLLSSFGFDGILESLGLPHLGTSTTSTSSTSSTSTTYQPTTTTTLQPTDSTTLQPPTDGTSTATSSSQSPSEVAGTVALVGIMLFGAVIAAEALELEQLTLIVTAVLEVAGQVLVGVVILAIGLYIANLAYRLIKSSGTGSSTLLAQIARVAILFLVGAMALGQINVAPGIVNLAFGLLLGAVAVAIAIAFGLGGRDVANEQLKKWVDKVK